MAKIEAWLSCDLKKPVQVQGLSGNVFSMDNNGSRINVRIYDNGEKTTVSGSVTANCILADGSTINVNGSLTTDNGQSVAYVDIPQSCLLVPGPIRIAIKLTASGVITTLAAVVTTVYRTQTDIVVTPSQQIINDWNAEISAAIASQNETIASAVSTQNAKIDELKSAIKTNYQFNANDADDYIGIDAFNYLANIGLTEGRVRTNNGNVDESSAYGTYATDFIPVESGKQYYLNFSYYTSGNYGLAYFNSSKEYISGAQEYVSGVSASTIDKEFSFTTPSSTSFVRVTVPKNLYDKARLSDKDFYKNCTAVPFEFEQSDIMKKYISSAGALGDSDNYYTVKVDLTGCRYIKVTNRRFSGTGDKTIAFYTSNDTVISSDGQMGSTDSIITQMFKVPASSAYCYISSRLYANAYGNFNTLFITKYIDANTALAMLEDVSEKEQEISDSMRSVENILRNNLMQNPVKNLFKKYLVGYRVNTATGKLEQIDNNVFASDYIPVESEKTYYINFSYYSGGNYGLAFYDASKAYLSGIKQAVGTASSDVEFSFETVENAAYIRITGDKTKRAIADVVVSDISITSNLYAYTYPINVSEYVYEGITSSGTVDSDNRFRTVFVDLTGCKYIKITTKRQSGGNMTALAFFASDGTFISSIGNMGTPAINRITSTHDVPENAAYCTVCDRTNDLYPVIVLYMYPFAYFEKCKDYSDKLRDYIINDYELKNYVYSGEKITLEPSFSCVQHGGDVIVSYTPSISEPTGSLSGQGCAVYGNLLFRGHDKGYFRVYDISDLSNITFVRDFELEGYDSNIHDGSVSFAPNVISGDSYPLLYVDYGLQIRTPMCLVERITNTTQAELVQTIDFSGVVPNWGYPCIGNDGYLYYTISDIDYGGHTIHIYKFTTPNISNSTVSMTSNDLVDDWELDVSEYTTAVFQSVIAYNGKIYIICGTEPTAKMIFVVNITTHNIDSYVPLTSSIPYEPEGMAIWKNSMIITINGGTGIFLLNF